jgi:ribosomal protein S12 methylthiotransferase accessory factor
MTVTIAGSGPAVAAVEAALEDAGIETTTGIETLGETTLAVVAGETGADIFERANERAVETDSRWLAVELGGVGGHPVADAAVAGFAPDAGCYDCLRGRVAANLDKGASETDETLAPETARFAGAVAGREAVRWLAGDADVGGRLVVAPFSERAFLPLPNCGCADERDPGLDRAAVERTVEESLARAERALDEQVGVVQEVGEAESFPVPYYLAQTCATDGFSDASAARDAAGVDADWNSAFMKALGEAFERYCAGVYRTADFETGAPTEMERSVDPRGFVCETEPAGEEIEWVTGESVATGDEVLVPAEFVYYPPPEQRYRPPTTTGLGLGNSAVEALLSGLYEVIERDAAMLSWYSSFDPLELAVEDAGFETLRGRAASEGLAVTPLLLTVDVDVPVVGVAVERETWPQIAFGTAANLDATAAARSALAEALQNWTELRGMGPEGAAGTPGAIGAYAQTPGAAAAFADPEMATDADAVGPETVPEGVAELDAVVERLADAGLTPYAARTTTRDIEALGFEAVRALVPTAQPLCFGEPYFGVRALSVPETLGVEPRTDRDHHPFP